MEQPEQSKSSDTEIIESSGENMSKEELNSIFEILSPYAAASISLPFNR